MYNAVSIPKKERRQHHEKMVTPSTYGPYKASHRLKETLEQVHNPKLTNTIGKWYHRLTYLINAISTMKSPVAEQVILYMIKKDFDDHVNAQLNKTEGKEKTAWEFLRNVGSSHYKDALRDIKQDIHEEYLRINNKDVVRLF